MKLKYIYPKFEKIESLEKKSLMIIKGFSPTILWYWKFGYFFQKISKISQIYIRKTKKKRNQKNSFSRVTFQKLTYTTIPTAQN
jgi:hypothetical protein